MMEMVIKALSVLCLSLLSNSIGAQQVIGSETTLHNSSAEQARVAQGSQMMFIDPETGQVTSKPAEVEMATINSSREVQVGTPGLASQPQLQADGSIKIDFNGQFNRPLNATIDQNGNLDIGHHVDRIKEMDDK